MASIAGSLVAQERTRAVVVSVMERPSRQPRTELSPNEVIIREDGIAREVLRVSRWNTPMHVALLVDNSHAAIAHVARLREGLRRFVARLAPSHELSLVTYAERPTLRVSFSKDRPQIEESIGRLFGVSGSGAYLLDALDETATGFLKRESARPVIVVVDVGGEPFSNLAGRRVLDRLKASGAQLHVVQLVSRGPNNSREAQDRSIVIDEGTRETGGRRADLLADLAIPDALAQLAAELESQFRVEYGRPDSLIPPRAVTVSSASPSLEIRGGPVRVRESNVR